MIPDWTGMQPIGLKELEDDAASRFKLRACNSLIRSNGIRCCVRGCNRWLAKRERPGPIGPDAYCPDHGVSVSTSPTYIYKDYRDNFIIAAPRLEQVKKFKVESWRLGYERSEDALTWNVFMGLARLNGLRSAFYSLTGMEIDEGPEPELYLWGIRVLDEVPRVWAKLKDVRRDLNEGAGWPTEPDVILRAPGRGIALIEAKFGSANGTLSGKKERFGGVATFLDGYPCAAEEIDPLNRAWIKGQRPGQVLQQLLRNVIFAQRLAEAGEVPFVVNLVRATDELTIVERLTDHLAVDSPVSFRRCTWEALFELPLLSAEDAKPLRHYLDNKTNKLARAFEQ